MNPLRVIFMGTAPLACASLQALADARAYEIAAVVTQPDRPKGRELKLQPSAVKELALRLGLPVLQPEKARDEKFIEQLRVLQPALIVVAAYGQILPQAILDLPRLGCLNVHTSLLPKHRGAAPIQWAIANGDAETGVTIMKMDAGLDTGGIVAMEATPIGDSDDAGTLHDRLAQLGAALLVKTIPDFAAGKLTPRPQPAEGASYARKIEKEDGRIEWSQPARVLWQRLRAFTPWPGAFTFLPGQGKPVLLKVWRAEVVETGRALASAEPTPDPSQEGKGAEAPGKTRVLQAAIPLLGGVRGGSSGIQPGSGAVGKPGEIIEANAQGIVVGCGTGALRLLEVQREGGKRLAAREFLAGCALTRGQKLE